MALRGANTRPDPAQPRETDRVSGGALTKKMLAAAIRGDQLIHNAEIGSGCDATETSRLLCTFPKPSVDLGQQLLID
jgi:hypothetical protein